MTGGHRAHWKYLPRYASRASRPQSKARGRTCSNTLFLNADRYDLSRGWRVKMEHAAWRSTKEDTQAQRFGRDDIVACIKALG